MTGISKVEVAGIAGALVAPELAAAEWTLEEILAAGYTTKQFYDLYIADPDPSLPPPPLIRNSTSSQASSNRVHFDDSWTSGTFNSGSVNSNPNQFINSTPRSNMSDQYQQFSDQQRQRHNMVMDDVRGVARKQSVGGKSVNVRSSSSSPYVSSRPVNGRNPKVSKDTFGRDRPMFDQQLVPSISGNSKLAPITMRLGKSVHVDPVPNFLSNLSQTGTVTCQWAGFIKTITKATAEDDFNPDGLDSRVYFATHFRHRLSVDKAAPQPIADAKYPALFTDNGYIMTPKSTSGYNLGSQLNSAGVSTPQGTVDGPYQKHTNGWNYWAPLNRADYEDMSWNLNKLKLARATSTAGEENPAFLLNAPLLLSNNHCRISHIEDNNKEHAVVYPVGNINPSKGTPYKYNMVFKKGVATYKFTNPLSTACRVEVIVFRMKKNTALTGKVLAYVDGDNSTEITGQSTDIRSNPMLNISEPIGVGYLDTAVGKLGTDRPLAANAGRTPLTTDVTLNPEFPFLPVLRSTVKKNALFSEQQRVAFALTAGGQREVDIVMEGKEYDPYNVTKNLMANLPVTDPVSELDYYPAARGCIDSLGYTVVIALNGVKMSRQFFSTPLAPANTPTQAPYTVAPLSSIVGECHCGAELQYMCNYVETIQGCHYKKPGSVNLYNDNLAADNDLTSVTTTVTQEAATIIPMERTVRNARKTTSSHMMVPTLAGTTQMNAATNVTVEDSFGAAH